MVDIHLIHRLENAVKFLKDNMNFRVGNYLIGITSEENIFVNFYSNYSNIGNLSRHQAATELDFFKSEFKLLMNQTKTFLKYSHSKKFEFNLLIDDDGASILVCREKNKKVIFFI